LASEEIMQLDTGELKITSLVGKTTLADCFNILKRAQLFVAADGGLLHLAVAASAKRIVSLFIVGIPPELRIPVNYRSDALTSASGDVNDIAVRAVANKIQARI
jgi:heptosyltransferase-2